MSTDLASWPELAVVSSEASVDGHSPDVDADLLVDDDHDDGDIADAGQGIGVRVADDRRPFGTRENTALMDEAFRAAGNPRFADVRFKTTTRTARASEPTLREIALKRRSPIIDWG